MYPKNLGSVGGRGVHLDVPLDPTGSTVGGPNPLVGVKLRWNINCKNPVIQRYRQQNITEIGGRRNNFMESLNCHFELVQRYDN
jgi:hypothetical protein